MLQPKKYFLVCDFFFFFFTWATYLISDHLFQMNNSHNLSVSSHQSILFYGWKVYCDVPLYAAAILLNFT